MYGTPFRFSLLPGEARRGEPRISEWSGPGARHGLRQRSRGRVAAWLTVAATGLVVVGMSGCGSIVKTTAASETGSSALSSFSCSASAITGSGTDNCTVTLSGAAGSGGVSVSLSSDNSSVQVPAAVTVAASASSATFQATVAAVSSSQTGTLTASAGGVTETFALQLTAGTTSTGTGAVLSVDATTVAFGSVALNTPSTQSVTLSSTGSSAVTVSGATVTGTGFTLAGGSFPITLNPGQTAVLNVVFNPASAGAKTGQISIASNSTGGATTRVALTGTGASATSTATYSVDLRWNAPGSSSDPVAGYHIYRSTGTGSAYQLLKSSVNVPTSYTDATVVSGKTYVYTVTSVDASGVESADSNLFTATIP